MKPLSLRAQIEQEEFDYQTLSAALTDYNAPRDKIMSLIEQGTIIRVKKGLYVFGKEWRRHSYSIETLANLVYGPSYISLEYALHYHGLIPEYVRIVTSVTTGRSRHFSTPVGDFSYRKISLPAFATGMEVVRNLSAGTYLMAVPEKALTDKLQSERGLPMQSTVDVEQYLVENLRIDIDDLVHLNVRRIEKYAALYGSRKAHYLAVFIRQVKNKIQ